MPAIVHAPIVAGMHSPKRTAKASLRLDPALRTRVQRVATALRRTESWIIYDCLERALPALEREASTTRKSSTRGK